MSSRITFIILIIPVREDTNRGEGAIDYYIEDGKGLLELIRLDWQFIYKYFVDNKWKEL